MHTEHRKGIQSQKSYGRKDFQPVEKRTYRKQQSHDSIHLHLIENITSTAIGNHISQCSQKHNGQCRYDKKYHPVPCNRHFPDKVTPAKMPGGKKSNPIASIVYHKRRRYVHNKFLQHNSRHNHQHNYIPVEPRHEIINDLYHKQAQHKPQRYIKYNVLISSFNIKQVKYAPPVKSRQSPEMPIIREFGISLG